MNLTKKLGLVTERSIFFVLSVVIKKKVLDRIVVMLLTNEWVS